MAGPPARGGGCRAATARAAPRRPGRPAGYWAGGGAPLDLLLELGADITNTDPFAAARGVPSRCGSCSYVESCGGGCAGRRQLLHALDEPDPYCPVVRGGSRKLKVQMAKSREL